MELKVENLKKRFERRPFLGWGVAPRRSSSGRRFFFRPERTSARYRRRNRSGKTTVLKLLAGFESRQRLG